MSVHSLHAIFSSLQGEGRNSGRPCTFVRFSTCNLSCAWCDTRKDPRMKLTTEETVRKVAALGNRSVVVTGGEPAIQPGLGELLEALKRDGRWLALETNGLVSPPELELFDYVAVSPKPQYAAKYVDGTMVAKADEVRIVAATDDIAPFCNAMRRRIRATDYYVSPLEKDGRIHYRRAMRLLGRANRLCPDAERPWALSIQQHKVLGIR